jgi:hypothetical protein
MDWQPSPENLSQLALCLRDSLSGFDKAARKQAEDVWRTLLRLLPPEDVVS